MSLRDEGFLFVYRLGIFLWVHPLELSAFDVDCTGMDDEIFEAFAKLVDGSVS